MEAYEIYREAVGGVTWNGDKMKEFNEMPEKQRNGWIAVQEHFKVREIKIDKDTGLSSVFYDPAKQFYFQCSGEVSE